MENKIGGGISSIMGDRFVKSDVKKEKIYAEATILYGHFMSQSLPYNEIEMWRVDPDFLMKKLEEILNTPDDSDVGYFNDADLK